MATNPYRAFSLIELLVVISIIAVLAAMLLPTIGMVRDQSKTVSCANNLKAAGAALMIYANENESLLPWGEAGPTGCPYSWVSAIGTLSTEEPVRLTCPSAAVQGGTYNFTGNLQTLPCRQFGNFRSTLKQVALGELPARAVLLFDAGLGQSTGGVNAFYSSMNMGWTFFYLQNNASDQTPTPLQADGGFRVQNRHGSNRKANYLFGDGHVGCFVPGDLTNADFRIPANGRRYF